MKTIPFIVRTGAFLCLVLLAFASPGKSETVPMPASATCYLFAYFLNNGQDGLHMAWSDDGYHWTALGGGRSMLTPEAGESKLLRDPCLLQGPDGTFRMVWTTSWNGQTIGYASSKDLLHWSAQQTIPVMAYEPKTRTTWAPEIFYDAPNGQYLIYWSSTIDGKFPETVSGGDGNHRIYYTTTRDFKTYVPTKLFFDPGFNCIDATILPDGGKYYLIFKNEVKNPTPEKNIWIATGSRAEGPYTDVRGPIKTTPQNWIEGPAAIKIGDEYRVYYDCYTAGHRIGVAVSKDLQHWEDASARMVNPPMKHGTILQVPSEVVRHILEQP